MNINQKKALLDLYIMQSNRASTTDAVAMLTSDQMVRVEESIRSASPNMTTLERAALQGKLDGMTVEAIAEQLGRGRGYIYQAITSAIKQIIAIFKIKAYSRMNGTNLHSPVELQPEMHAESHLEEHPMSLL